MHGKSSLQENSKQEYITVNTFAELPPPDTMYNLTAFVATATGVIYINRREAGLYKSSGQAWEYLGSILQYYQDEGISYALETKQDKLISYHTIKTINNQSLLGSGNIDIIGGSDPSIGQAARIVEFETELSNAYTTGYTEMQYTSGVLVGLTTWQNSNKQVILFTKTLQYYQGNVIQVSIKNESSNVTLTKNIVYNNNGAVASITKIIS